MFINARYIIINFVIKSIDVRYLQKRASKVTKTHFEKISNLTKINVKKKNTKYTSLAHYFKSCASTTDRFGFRKKKQKS